jgi:hypothetical protein
MNKIVTTMALVLVLGLISTSLISQNVTSRELGVTKISKARMDSLKKIPYPYHFPILGDKVRKMGFDIPLPNGIMVNYVVGEQNVTINNLSVGLHDDPDSFKNVDGIARFEYIKPFVNVINVRYDVWILPFIDFYILGGYVNSKTDIKLILPFEAEFQSKSEGPMVGWGVAGAAGVGPLFLQLDYNMVWTFVQQLYEPNLAQVFDIRVGHSFKLKKRPWSNVSIMLGTQWLKLNPYSRGSVDISAGLGGSGGDKGRMQEDLTDWYSELPQKQQATVREFYEALQDGLSGEGDKYLYYTFDKKLYYPWSMTAAVNYQINRRYILMAMYTFLGSRNQLTVSLNYRFGFKGKNVLGGVEF